MLWMVATGLWGCEEGDADDSLPPDTGSSEEIEAEVDASLPPDQTAVEVVNLTGERLAFVLLCSPLDPQCLDLAEDDWLEDEETLSAAPLDPGHYWLVFIGESEGCTFTEDRELLAGFTYTIKPTSLPGEVDWSEGVCRIEG